MALEEEVAISLLRDERLGYNEIFNGFTFTVLIVGAGIGLSASLAPQNIHVAHFVIDGAIRSVTRQKVDDQPDRLLDPDA